MSPSSVCQGLQSCLEPLVIEPRVLRLKLAPPASNLSNSTRSDSLSESDAYEKPLTNTSYEHDMQKDKDSESGGCTWSFLQSLSNICNKTKEPEDDKGYLQPKIKCSSSTLSAKSLEMCTESLGCETGSNASDSSDDMSLFSSSENSSYFISDDLLVNRISVPKKLNRGSSFPPPLTSMTDFGGLQVRPHREDGRLILEAVTSSPPQPYFQAERSNGRLRLRLFENVASFCGDELDADGEEEACGEGENGAEDELEEYAGNGEDEMGMTRFARPSRCKEGGNRDIFGDGYFELPSLSMCL